MNDKKIALICVHNGNDYYLDYALRQAHLFNRDADIYLLGNESSKDCKYAQHVLNANYFDSANAFEKVYQHMSSNLYGYELFCFQRWFIIKDFITEKKIDYFLCLDSDTLLYCNVSEVFNQYTDYDFTTCRRKNPCFTLFHRETLEKFCSLLTEMYTNDKYLNQLKDSYQNDFILAKRAGGVCDMTGIDYYREYISNNIKELTEIDNGKSFDGNLNADDGYEMESGKKKIYWKDNKPYGKRADTGNLVELQGLHFQGPAKFKMHKYLVDENLKLKTGFFYNLEKEFSPGLIKVKCKRYKRGITKLLAKL